MGYSDGHQYYDSRFPDKYKFLEEKKQKSRFTTCCNQECSKHSELVHAIRLITAKEFDKKRLHRLIDEKIFNCGNTWGGCGRSEFAEARGKESKVSLCESLFDFV